MIDRLLGRDRELAELEGAWATASGGRGALVLLRGEPGIGKTRLAATFAAGRRAVVLRPDVAAWGSWAGLLADGPGERPLRERQGEGWAREDLPIASRREAAGEAILAALDRACAGEALLVVLDDLHAWDAASRAVLPGVVQGIRGRRVLLLATARTVDGGGPEVDAELDALARLGTTLALGGLSLEDVRALVAHRVDTPRLAEVATAAHTISRGNPLFVDGLVRAGLQGGSFDGLLAGRVELASDVRAVIRGRLRRLSAGGTHVARALAVVGGAAAVPVLVRVTGSPAVDVLAGLDELDALQIAAALADGRIAFTHPLLAEAVYADLAGAERVRLHAAAAAAIVAIHGDRLAGRHAELFRHHDAAAVLDEGRAALRHASLAAEEELRTAAFEAAAEHAERAVAWLDSVPEVPDRDARRIDLWMLCGEARLAWGRRPAAREAFAAGIEVARRAGLPEGLARGATGIARCGEFAAQDDRFELLEEARVALAGRDSPALVQVLAALAGDRFAIPGAFALAEADSREAMAMARRLGGEPALVDAIGARIRVLWAPEHLEERLRLTHEFEALASGAPDLERRLEAHRHRLNALVEACDIAGAEREIEAYGRVARALRRPQPLFNAVLREGLLPQLRGDLAGALRAVDALEEAGRRAGDPQAERIAAARGLLIAVDAEDRPAVRVGLPRLAAIPEGPHFPMYRLMRVHGHLCLEEREPAEALYRSVVAAWGERPRDFSLLATSHLAAVAAAELDDRAFAARLLPDLRPFADLHASIGATHSFGTVAHAVALLADRLGLRDEALAAADRAVALETAMGAPRLAERSRILRARIGATAPRRAVDRGAFRRTPEGWHLELDGRAATLPDARAMGWIATLLARPGVEVAATELDPPAADEAALPALDARAKAAYKARIEDLRDQIDEAERFGQAQRAARATAELTALTRELSAAVGLGGRDRQTGASAERARTRVSKGITRAIERIATAHEPLGRHLAHSIRTGGSCAYHPEREVEWRLG